MNTARIEIAQFLNFLTPVEAAIVRKLRSIVLDTFPDFSEKYSYNVPYYFYKRRVAFIWPASIKPGPAEGVQLGICNGALLKANKHLLQFGTRKQVGIITVLNEAEIRENDIEALITEAITIERVFEQLKREL